MARWINAAGTLMIGFGLLSVVSRPSLPAPEGHQASFRLFVDRAHGDHRVAFAWAADRQFRRPAAHDRAF
jgi:uncharacterized protein YbaA (DUF1428 family)